MNQLSFRITNLTCEACVKMCTLILKKLPAISTVAIELRDGSAMVEADQTVTIDDIRQALASRKYTIVTEAV